MIDSKIYVASNSFGKNKSLVGELEKLGLPIEVAQFFHTNGIRREPTEEELVRVFSEAKIIVLGRTPLKKTTIDKLSNLKIVAAYGVGLDHIDQNHLAKKGIKLLWKSGVNKRAVAELTLGLMLNHFRNLSISFNKMRQGQWHKDGGEGLDGKIIGIVGMGHIGSELRNLLSPWNCNVIYHDLIMRDHEVPNVTRVGYFDLLQKSDVITYHVPLTELTHSMLSVKEISLLKSNALVINTSRGAVVEFDSVKNAVFSGKIAGFACDVFEEEPFDGSGTLHERVYLTPHIGGNSIQAVLAMGKAVIDSLRDELIVK